MEMNQAFISVLTTAGLEETEFDKEKFNVHDCNGLNKL